jgi:hypothetical protein
VTKDRLRESERARPLQPTPHQERAFARRSYREEESGASGFGGAASKDCAAARGLSGGLGAHTL